MAKVKNISEYKSPGDTIITKAVALETAQRGIYIPDESQNKSFFKVIETGLQFNSKDISIGDIVLISGKGGDKIDLQDSSYWIFPTDMVIATVEE